MRIYIHQMIARLGRRLSLRQTVLSTAEVYISRFLTRVSLLEVNLYMLIAAAVYLACKICESPQHIRTVSSEARNCWPEFITVDFTKLAELEFYLIEEMECYMIIHHPYTSLMQLVEVLGQSENSTVESSSNIPHNRSRCESEFKIGLTSSEIENAWQIINDSYMTDLPLLYPPHIIAIAALHLTLVLRLNTSDFDVMQEGKGVRSTAKSIANLSSGKSNNSADPLMPFMLANTQGNTPKSKEVSGSTNNGTTLAPASAPSSNTNSGLRRKLSQSSKNNNFTHNLSGSLMMSTSVSPEKSNSPNPQLGEDPTLPAVNSSISPSTNTNTNTNTITNMNKNTNVNKNTSTICGPSSVRLDTYTNFLAASNVNLAEVMESVRELLGLYDSWQQYDEGSVRQGMKMLLMALHNSQSKQG